MPRTSRVVIDWNPDPVVFADAILTVEEALRDTRLPLLASKEFVQEDIQKRFQTQTDPSGEPWEEWAESYKPYAEEFPNIGILRQTDELYQAATSESAFVVNSNTVFYAAENLPARGIWHQEGRPGRRTRQGTANPLPQRQFLGMEEGTRTLIFATFSDWFDRAIDLFATITGRTGRRHAMRGAMGRFIPRSTPMPPRVRFIK